MTTLVKMKIENRALISIINAHSYNAIVLKETIFSYRCLFRYKYKQKYAFTDSRMRVLSKSAGQDNF